MAELDELNRRWVKTRTVQECVCCGRSIPVGSRVVMRKLRVDGTLTNVRECPECSDAIEGCKRLRSSLNWDRQWPIRKLCAECDEFPWCENVAHVRKSKPGDFIWHLVDGCL